MGRGSTYSKSFWKYFGLFCGSFDALLHCFEVFFGCVFFLNLLELKISPGLSKTDGGRGVKATFGKCS